jgi:Toprim domain
VRLLAFAKDVWAGSLDAPGTLAESYLQSRGITCRLAATLGFVEDYKGLPAMIAAFGLPTEPEPDDLRISADDIEGVHLTFLRPDGSGKAVDADGRSKIIIGRGHSMPIVLAPPNGGLGLCIAEGIEDALSAHQETGLGAWAAGTANRLPGLAVHVPAYIECVTVLQDDDDAGRRFSGKLADALHTKGVEVLISVIERGEANGA